MSVLALMGKNTPNPLRWSMRARFGLSSNRPARLDRPDLPSPPLPVPPPSPSPSLLIHQFLSCSTTMRVFPRVSQPTLDSFRKDIYRPRLALLLLILLLSGNEPRHAEGQVDNVAIHSLASGQRIADKRRLNGAMSQSYSARDNVRAEASSSFLTLDRIPFIAALHRDTTSGQKRRQQWKSSRGGAVAPEKLTGSSDSKRKSTRRSSSTNPSITTSLLPRALFRLPKLSWRVLIEGNALSAVVPLHMLWLVRLGGMMVEDTINRVGQRPNRAASSSFFP